MFPLIALKVVTNIIDTLYCTIRLTCRGLPWAIYSRLRSAAPQHSIYPLHSACTTVLCFTEQLSSLTQIILQYLGNKYK